MATVNFTAVPTSQLSFFCSRHSTKNEPVVVSCTSNISSSTSLCQTALSKQLVRREISQCSRRTRRGQNSHFVVRGVQEDGQGGEPSPSVSSSNESGGEAPKQTVVRRKRSSPPPDVVDANLRDMADKSISVEGVAKVDRGDEGVNPILQIVALAGWIFAAYMLGDYRPDVAPPVGGAGAGAVSGVKTWALGVPVGLAIRGLTKGQVPPTPFILVSLASTFVILVGWRAAFAALTSKEETKRAGNRKGNPFEFFQLLASLVKRW
eukprot:jgi/Mesen1/10907/ME000095S10245